MRDLFVGGLRAQRRISGAQRARMGCARTRGGRSRERALDVDVERAARPFGPPDLFGSGRPGYEQVIPRRRAVHRRWQHGVEQEEPGGGKGAGSTALAGGGGRSAFELGGVAGRGPRRDGPHRGIGHQPSWCLRALAFRHSMRQSDLSKRVVARRSTLEGVGDVLVADSVVVSVNQL